MPFAASDIDTWPDGESDVGATFVEPFGAVTDTVAAHADPASIFSTAFHPALPVKVSFALWPGAVVAMFADRETAESAVDVLLQRGFTDDQISLVARGAGTDDQGKFLPGGLMVTVSAKNREDEAERLLREHEAREVTTNRIGATGKVGEET